MLTLVIGGIDLEVIVIILWVIAILYVITKNDSKADKK